MGSGGAPASAVQAGLIPRITAHLLAANANDPSAVVTLTLLEVYKERIRCAKPPRAPAACASFGGARPAPCGAAPHWRRASARLTPRRRSDLLCPSRDNLQVHEGPRGTFVGDATEVRARE